MFKTESHFHYINQNSFNISEMVFKTKDSVFELIKHKISFSLVKPGKIPL